MSHNILKHLNVNLTLTHPCAESMPQYMGTDFWKITRLPVLLPCPRIFRFVIRGGYTLDRIVNERLCVDLPGVVQKDEIALSLYNKFFPNGVPFLTFPL